MAKRRVCVVTGSRAEYGLLSVVMRAIQQDADLELQVVATGMHLSPEFGLTWRVLEDDGFPIDAKVEMLLSSDSPVGIAKSIGLGTMGCADAFDRLKPDILLLLGDRFEILAAAQAALVARIPIAHIAGGDTTEGAFDEAIRHSITKMAHLHFVTNEGAAKRVRQLGENPEQIHVVGSPGIDQIRSLKLLTRQELAQELCFDFKEKNLLVTFHPVTLEDIPAKQQFQELLDALDQLGNGTGLIFTKPNADTDGREIIAMIDAYVATRPHTRAYTSLGQLRYLSAMAQVDAVVGNSSSGLYEAPSFGKPTVNIGDRQKGRLQASSVVNCGADAGEILAAIGEALHRDCSGAVNPYGDGHGAERIVSLLKQLGDPKALLKKHFHEVAL
ncbi:UDP-N-acetylglucosamine 2-epimerase [Geomonas azotofigens]|uniref:UDP-N-acetylglucosamine 2-epimerase n=1 Tax=Geomonas azotofigens TaxID=2843196 RepID=UPI001C103F27|nr:UDP-N-acetylglucosamine 2-epimerase [Geomonas azotofigens]MBU5615220.1 UDP-N-acetylglucosamine 2-epimerase (hydrolyzing) [Geomonas azotofigens]